MNFKALYSFLEWIGLNSHLRMLNQQSFKEVISNFISNFRAMWSEKSDSVLPKMAVILVLPWHVSQFAQFEATLRTIRKRKHSIPIVSSQQENWNQTRIFLLVITLWCVSLYDAPPCGFSLLSPQVGDHYIIHNQTASVLNNINKWVILQFSCFILH